MKSDVIFISYSKLHTNRVGVVFKRVLDQLYNDKNVMVFLSNKSLASGDIFRDEIARNLSNAKCGISILTPENKLASPWLMYEAGALAIKARENGGKLLPFLFCRERDDVESPLTQIQSPEYQPDDNNNLQSFIEYFQSIDKTLSAPNRLGESIIRAFIVDHWKSEFSVELELIASDMSNFSVSSYGEKRVKSGVNESLSLRSAETHNQEDIRLFDSFAPETPADIEYQLEKIVKSQIPKEWLVRNREDIERNEHRVLVNNTRFSTFVSFTDGERIVLFDRARDKPNINVYNERFDVFGSVQFENRTIKNKIKNSEFFRSPIIKIEEIGGVAIEDNRDKRRNEITETVVMLGVCVYLRPEHLDLAAKDTINKEIGIYGLRKLFDLTRESLTSKATLSISHSLGKMK
ncbi:MAG: toll/interleukin-1 receptor domain-containing protein [Candidatus Thiodiazotropha sp. (ex Dulcina madagascariensis)]|nr:toll/interleukin-1 receptor domain-containing protein [Candidatus Thiodiazotropha sp. (ex Dulcina madagascariensis)]